VFKIVCSIAARGALGVALLVATPGGVGAQTSEADPLARAYSALASGRFVEALQLAERVLAASPRHHDAASIAVRAAAAAGAIEGLNQYERWLAAVRAEDAHMLEPVARAVLGELSRSGGTTESAARRALQDASGETPASIAAAEEARGRQIAGELGSRDPGNKLLLLRTLGTTGYRDAAPQVLPLLSDPVPDVRAAAAEALGALGADSAIPSLRPLLQDRASEVRSAAALALRRLGDGSGDAIVSQLLTSEVPDIQLQAAEALSGEPPSSWAPYIEPLLGAEAPMTRLLAARLLLPVQPERAGAVLATLLSDPNPVVVGELAGALVEAGLTDMPTIRRLLRHPSPDARLRGAEALLRLTGAHP
jgi:hypothetical protein